MSDYKGYRCPNCGSMIPATSRRIIKCGSCGSEYEREDEYLKPLIIEVSEVKLVNLEYRERLRDEYLINDNMKELYIKHTLDGIAHQLAKDIIPYMEVKSYKDLQTMETIINGRIKIGINN